MATYRAIRGMHDVLPEATPRWQRLEQAVRGILNAHDYREIRLPMMELTEVFERSIGEATDIVEKEMYTFADRNADRLTLRPEGTAGCVRAGLEHGLFHNKTPRLWYAGPMFRHERPQRGRLRQFHQIGAEAFGMPGPDIDAELILVTSHCWRVLGIADLTLEVNSLGTPAARQRYRDVLLDYFQGHRDALDDDSRRRLRTNPLRILDSKNPDMAALIAEAPTLADYLDDASRAHFQELLQILGAAGLAPVLNPRLVRGLDYYTKTVFEWTTERLGAQGTVCAGGRYDGLVELFGGRPTPAVGFAMGIERLVEMLPTANEDDASGPHAVLLSLGAEARRQALIVADDLRTRLPSLRLRLDLGGGNLKRQLKRAYESGARVCLILGAEEVAQDKLAVRSLNDDSASQITVARSELADHLRATLALGSPV